MTVCIQGRHPRDHVLYLCCNGRVLTFFLFIPQFKLDFLKAAPLRFRHELANEEDGQDAHGTVDDEQRADAYLME